MTNTEFIPKSATILGVYESTLEAAVLILAFI
jgi:hypothetical protein